MQTLSRPPAVVKTNQENRKYYTLHKNVNSVMAWNANTSKMAVVAFSRERDVKLLGHMIESHYEKQREWPDFSSMTLVSSEPMNIEDDFSILGVVQWSDIDKLRVFCVEHYFDLILVEQISNTFRIRGSVFQLSIPEKFFVPYLTKLLDQSAS
ncbi:hypothetical protein EBT25_05060 [bacterium]|nr:hypothetical protein [bacterium]